MKVNNKMRNDKETVKINMGVSILLAVVLSFISIGYAVYGQRLNVVGNVTFENNQGVVSITNVTFVTSSSYNASANPAVSADGNSIDFNLTYAKEEGTTHSDYRAVFEVTIDNDTYYDYGFNLANFRPVIQNSQGIPVEEGLYVYLAADGPQLGDTIPAGESITFQIYMDFAPAEDDTYTVIGDMDTELEEQPHGSLLATIPNGATGDLRESQNKDLATFTVSVINSYQSSRTFTLSISDPAHFQLVGQDGTTPLGNFTIAAGEEQTYTFYVARVANAVYANSSFQVSIDLTYSEGTVNCGNVTLLVDEVELEDTIPPRISNVVATIADASSCTISETKIGKVNISWDSTTPESGVERYYVIAHNTSTNTDSDPQDAGTSKNYTFTGLASGNYYFKVYGINNDGYGRSSSEIAEYGATSGNGTSYTWQYTVSLTGNEYMQTFSNGKVNRGCTYQGTLNAKTDDNSYYYYVPTRANNVSVTVGSTSYSTTTSTTPVENAFRYPNVNSNSTSSTIYIYYVRGNTTITATGTRSQKNSGGCG